MEEQTPFVRLDEMSKRIDLLIDTSHRMELYIKLSMSIDKFNMVETFQEQMRHKYAPAMRLTEFLSNFPSLAIGDSNIELLKRSVVEYNQLYDQLGGTRAKFHNNNALSIQEMKDMLQIHVLPVFYEDIYNCLKKIQIC